MEPERLIPLLCWIGAAWAVAAVGMAWWIWRHSYPLPTPPNVIRFEDIRDD